jgi:hypothetical protein
MEGFYTQWHHRLFFDKLERVVLILIIYRLQAYAAAMHLFH